MFTSCVRWAMKRRRAPAQALGRWLVEFYLSDDMLENVEMMCPLR